MAGIVPSFQKLNLLLCKQQTTVGTKETPLVYTDYIALDDTFTLDYKKEFTEQGIVQGIFGNPQSVPGLSSVDVKVSMPITPTGAATLPTITPLLNACGNVYALSTKKHTWIPTSTIASNWKDVTLWGYTGDKTAGDSILTKAHSIMFDLEIAGEVGKPVIATFTGKGVPDGVPAAASYPTDAIALLATVPPAVLKNTTMTINGLTLNILKFSVKWGNDVQFIKSPSDDSGYLQSMIVGRKSTFSVTAYHENASVNNPIAGMAAGTLATTVIKFGSAADSLISFTSGTSKSELTACKYGVDNGLMTWEFEGNFIDNSFTFAINDA